MAQADRDKWNRKYRERGIATRDPASFLVQVADALPTGGRALDVAGGSGRHALWLAERGLQVTLCDVSEVGLDLARAEADRAGLELDLLCVDLEAEPFPPGPWDVLVCFHYLWRPLFAVFPQVLAPGGVLVFVQPTRTNLERHEHPSARFLLEDFELPGLVQDLEILRCEEGWSDEGRYEARLLAQRPLDP